MTYFVLRLLLWLLLAGAVFFLLGWLFRGTRMQALLDKVKGDLIDEQQRHREAKHRQKELTAREQEQRAELAKRQTKLDQLNALLASGGDGDPAVESAALRRQLQEAAETREALEARLKESNKHSEELAAVRRERDRVAIELDRAKGAVEREQSLRDTLAEKDVELQELRRERDQLRAGATGGDSGGEALAKLEAERDELLEKLAAAETKPAAPGAGQGQFLFGDESIGSPEYVTTLREERDAMERQLNTLKSSLANAGQYASGAVQSDDLTRIKGVADVLSHKLNSYGIYTYRQIADWDEDERDSFDHLLAFSGRIGRDDWVGQAKALHEQKYGPEP